MDFEFNAYGGLDGGLYYPWDKDDQIAQKILEIEKLDRYRAPFIAEMGGIQTDGQRTLLTTEQCLLNRNRNAHLGKDEMTRRLSDYLGAEQVIWLPRGCKFDETDGHIDDLACFVRPGVVVMQWTDDRDDPQWEIYQEAYDILRSTRDARGRALEVHKLPQPRVLTWTAEEAAGLDQVDGTHLREEGTRICASYINYYAGNSAIVLPLFGDAHDQAAGAVLAELFPRHRIVGIENSREILLGAATSPASPCRNTPPAGLARSLRCNCAHWRSPWAWPWAPARQAASEPPRVNLYIWSEYLAPDTLSRFEARTGIKVVADHFDSLETVETKLLTGRSGYDLVLTAGQHLQRAIASGALQPLDKARLPHFQGLDPEFTAHMASFDPGNRYAGLYVWGTTGFGYQEEAIRARMADAPTDSWAMLMDPAVVARFADCGVSLLNDPNGCSPPPSATWGWTSTARASTTSSSPRRTWRRSARRSATSTTTATSTTWPTATPAWRCPGTATWPSPPPRPSRRRSRSSCATASPGGHADLVRRHGHPQGRTAPGRRPGADGPPDDPETIGAITNSIHYANAVPAAAPSVDPAILADPAPTRRRRCAPRSTPRTTTPRPSIVR